MSAPDGEGFGGWTPEALKTAWAVVRELWVGFLTPAVLAWWTWYKLSVGRADARAKDERTEQQRRDDAFNAKMARADEQVRQHVLWLESRAERANAERDRADARADAAERAERRLELWLRDHEHALANARQIADDARAKASLPPAEWKAVPRPTLPGDPA